MQKIPVIIVLSGLDPTGGAGLLADIRASAAAGTRIAPLITANTLQGRNKPAQYIPVDSEFLAEQLDMINLLFSPEAVKIGMMGSAKNALVIADSLKKNRLLSVVDPVMCASSGGSLADNDIRTEIVNMADLVTLLTPNRDELAWLSGKNVGSMDDIDDAVCILFQKGFRNILVKGGHFDGNPVDHFYADGQLLKTFTGVRHTITVRGTGCHFATYAAAMLAKRFAVYEAVDAAYTYVQSMFLNYYDSGNGILPADSPVSRCQKNGKASSGCTCLRNTLQKT